MACSSSSLRTISSTNNAYVGTDFRGDPDLLLPPGVQWEDIGKKQNPKNLLDYNFSLATPQLKIPLQGKFC